MRNAMPWKWLPVWMAVVAVAGCDSGNKDARSNSRVTVKTVDSTVPQKTSSTSHHIKEEVKSASEVTSAVEPLGSSTESSPPRPVTEAAATATATVAIDETTTLGKALANVPRVERTPTPANPDPNSKADTYDVASKTLIQPNPASDDTEGRGVDFPNISGSPGEDFTLGINGKALEGATILIRGKGIEQELLPSETTDNQITFSSGSKIPDVPAGTYDLILVRQDGSKVLRPGALVVRN